MERRQEAQLDASAQEEPAAADEGASGRSWAKVAKAASISRLVLALRSRVCSPMISTAASSSRNVTSAEGRLDRLVKRREPCLDQLMQEFEPLRGQLGSQNTDTCHVASGRARVGTRPSLTGSPPVEKTIGMVVVAFLAANGA